MNEQYCNVHDNEILSYHVDIINKRLQLLTKYSDTEKTTITFNGLMGHRFENVTYCNIINRITQRSIDDFIDENRDMLEHGLRYAFPVFAENCEDFRTYLKEKENDQKIFEISSTLGLCGFVIAEEIVFDINN